MGNSRISVKAGASFMPDANKTGGKPALSQMPGRAGCKTRPYCRLSSTTLWWAALLPALLQYCWQEGDLQIWLTGDGKGIQQHSLLAVTIVEGQIVGSWQQSGGDGGSDGDIIE